MALSTLSPEVHLARFTRLSPVAKLGNVYGPGGGFNHSPLGSGVDGELVDMAGDHAFETLADLATAAAQATTYAVEAGFTPSDGGGDGGGGSDGGPGGSDGGPGDGGAGAGSGDSGAGTGGDSGNAGDF